MIITWKDAYKVGDAEIDAQHQELFRQVNTFMKATDKAGLTSGAMSLFKYTREHFKHEENLMRRINFPALESHLQQHNDLIARLSDISASIASDTLNMTDLGAFLSDWLLGHIRIYDTKLATYVNKIQ